jgi:predicted small integral membrane protein
MSASEGDRFRRAAWCGVVVVALHNAEEALTILDWLPPRLSTLAADFGIRPLAVNAERLYVGLLMATIVPLAWVAFAVRSAPRSVGAHSIFVLYGVFCANAFVPHLLGVLLVKDYVPGAITAGLLVVPYTAWLSHRAVVDRHVSRRGLVVALGAAITAYAPGCVALLGVRSVGL